MKNGDILWCNYSDSINDIRCNYIGKDELNLVAWSDVLQTTKKTVPMSCNSNVSRLARMGRSNNASHAAVQGKVVGAVKDGHLQMNLRNLQYSQRSAEHMTQALVVCVNPLVTPQTGVNTGSPTNRIVAGMCR